VTETAARIDGKTIGRPGWDALEANNRRYRAVGLIKTYTTYWGPGDRQAAE
jgi:hypothetical protein